MKSLVRVLVVLVVGVLVGGVRAGADDYFEDAGQARARLWYLDGLGVSKAWSVSKGKGVTVCVVESGVKQDATATDREGRDGFVASTPRGGGSHESTQ